MKKLSVNLVTWNGAKYIPFLFDSLRKQSFKDWSFYVLDNGSSDSTVELIKKELENFSVEHRLIVSSENAGFAGGHARAFRETKSDYVLLLNQDMYLSPDCFEKMVGFMEKNPDVAAATPRLMRWNFAQAGENLEKSFSGDIDALGLKIFRNRRVVEQYTKENWEDIKKKTGDCDILEVFGVSGAFPVYRRSGLQSTLLANGDFLDSSYHSYKEDVDLSFRFLSAGYRSCVILNTCAYHDRAGAGPKEMDDGSAARNKKTQSEWVKYHSYKNHIATLIKNEYGWNFSLDLPWILWYELKKLGYFLLFDPRVILGLRELWKNRAIIANNRKMIKNRRKADWKEIRRWWK